MKLAFCLFKYFPYGGLQRDFLRIAKAAYSRGHEIHIYTIEWQGEEVPGFHMHYLPVRTMQNHTRSQLFGDKLKRHLAKDKMDLVIGFNKIPNLDFYYAADVCYKAKVYAQRSLIYRWLPRYRSYMKLEKSVFLAGKKTDILLISPLQQKEYQRYYQTESERFHLLPPGISRDRLAPDNYVSIRQGVREMMGYDDEQKVILFIGSSFHTKGLDRAIKAVAALPNALREKTHLLIVGQDHPGSYGKLAKKLGVTEQVDFLGGRNDVPNLILASDLLLHPARTENTGTVLLEALAGGLPVVTVDVCGYAHYITESETGVVIASPFNQIELNGTLQALLDAESLHQWQQNALIFAKTADIYSLPERAVDIIEQRGAQK